jgi:hypothetical protein
VTVTDALLPGSLRQARAAFATAPPVALHDLVGVQRATFVGPGWWTAAGPLLTRLGGMPGWWGKHFWWDDYSADGAGHSGRLAGENLLHRGGRLVPSFPMRAQVRPSRFDGRPALVVSYPAPAPWVWRQVTDELRPLESHPGVLVGLTLSSAPVLTAGLPFLLERVDVPVDGPRR